MNTFFIALVVFAVAITGMAIGVIIKGKCIKGTCGGLNQLRDETGRPICEACAPEKVEALRAKEN